ncbi:MAG: hypothetical protein HY868_11995 [Chloroflexi bacterium]|nr:hypothetical protein [Chloroflexota bacterium]
MVGVQVAGTGVADAGAAVVLMGAGVVGTGVEKITGTAAGGMVVIGRSVAVGVLIGPNLDTVGVARGDRRSGLAEIVKPGNACFAKVFVGVGGNTNAIADVGGDT